MRTTSKNRKSSSKSHFTLPRWVISYSIMFGIFILGLISYNLMLKPAAINIVGSTEPISTSPVKGTIVNTTNLPTAPAGCRYQNVQCIQAPCDPVLVCDTTVASTSATSRPVPSASPSPTPIRSPLPPTTLGVTSFSVSGACGSSSFTNITYSCNNSKTIIKLATGVCTDFNFAFKKAQMDCRVSGVTTQ